MIMGVDLLLVLKGGFTNQPRMHLEDVYDLGKHPMYLGEVCVCICFQ